MGLTSLLKPALKIGASFIPGGSTATSILDTLGTAGSQAAGGLATERGGKNAYNAAANAADTSRYGIEQGAAANLAGLDERALQDRARLGLEAPTARANQVGKGSLMSTLQPARITHPRATIPKMTGGMTSILSDPAFRAAGNELKAQAGEALRTKSDVPAPVNYSSSARVAAPELRGYEEPGTGESMLGIGGNVAKIIAALARQGAGGRGGDAPLPEMDSISRSALGF